MIDNIPLINSKIILEISLMKQFKEEKEEMEDMIRENLNTKLENERKNNRKDKVFKIFVNKNSKIKESMNDVINNNTPNVSKRKNSNNYQTIKNS